MRRYIGILAVILTAILILAACSSGSDSGGSQNDSANTSDQADSPEASTENPDSASGESGSSEEPPSQPESEATSSTDGEATESVSQIDAQSSDDLELTDSITWPEAGLTLLYPAGWAFAPDQRFDFVLMEPPEEGDDSVTYIALQTGSAGRGESLRDVMVRVAGDDSDTLTEVTVGGADAWQLEITGEDQRTWLVGFSPAAGQIGLLNLSSSLQTWDNLELTFTAILGSATVTPLEIDHELLNAQMLASYENDGSLTVGDSDAPTIIVEFMDFSCGHCAEYSHSIDRLVQDYVVPGKARFSFGILTFVAGDLSERAGVAQVCGARMGVGWDMHQVVFGEYMAKGAQAAYTQENLLEAVSQADLDIDMAEFETCLADEAMAELLISSAAWATELGVEATPTVFVGSSNDDLELAPNRSLLNVYRELDLRLD